MYSFYLKRFFKNSYESYKMVSVYPVKENKFLICVNGFRPQHLLSVDLYEDALEALMAWRDTCEKTQQFVDLMDPMCQTWEITEREFKEETAIPRNETT